MTNLFALALIATMSNMLNTARIVCAYADQYAIDHCLDGAFPIYVPAIKTARTCATTGMSLEEKVIYKAMRLGARRGATKSPSARVRLNDEAKRASITLMCMNAQAANAAKRAADAHAIARNGNTLSDATKAARQAQSSAQLALNAVRALARAIEPKKAHVAHTPVVHTPTTKVRAPKRARVYHMMHTVESVAQRTAEREELALIEAKHQASLAKHKADKEIARARRAAQRKLWIQLRAEKIARMCADAWYNKGIWVDPALAEACNDSDYSIRVSAYTELCALVGVAA